MLKPILDFDYWGLPVYLIVLTLGAIISYILFKKRMRVCGASVKTKKIVFWTLVLSATISIFGANVVNWLTNPHLLGYPFIERILFGGYSFYYGMLIFLGLSLLLLKLFKQSHRFWVNELVPSVVMFNIIGRIGCLLVGCCYGIPFFGQGFNVFGIIIDTFPVRLLEITFMVAIFVLFNKKFHQNRLFWYLTAYSTIRFTLEFLRFDNHDFFYITWLTPAQVTSILIWLGLGVYLLVKYMKKTPFFNDIEAYTPDTNPFDVKSYNKKRDYIIVSAFCLIAIVITIFITSSGIPFVDSIKLSAYNAVIEMFKERSIVTYDESGNVFMDMKERTATASMRLQQGEERTVTITQAASGKQNYALDFNDLVYFEMYTATGELILERTVFSIEFSLPSSNRDTHYNLVIGSAYWGDNMIENNENSRSLQSNKPLNYGLINPISIAGTGATNTSNPTIRGTVSASPTIDNESNMLDLSAIEDELKERFEERFTTWSEGFIINSCNSLCGCGIPDNGEVSQLQPPPIIDDGYIIPEITIPIPDIINAYTSKTIEHFLTNKDTLYKGIPMRLFYIKPNSGDAYSLQIVFGSPTIIYIDLFFEFQGPYNEYFLPTENCPDYSSRYTYKDVFIEGIIERWSNVFALGRHENGVFYDFQEGFLAVTKVNIHTDSNIEGQRYINISFNSCGHPRCGANTNPNSFNYNTRMHAHCINNYVPAMEGDLKYTIWRWSNKFSYFRIYMVTNDVLPIERRRRFEAYKGVAAHEVGHILGLNDAYPEGGVDRADFNAETRYRDDMMRNNIKVSSNHIEMILYAYSNVYVSQNQIEDIETEFQSFKTFDEQRGTREITRFIKSDAIKFPN